MNSDFKDLLKILSDQGVKYLIVGGYAVVEYAEPRFTKDLDIWVGADADNAKRLVAALKAFGAPLFGLTEADFATEGNVLQLGVPPTRIDFLTSIDGVSFADAWERRVSTLFDDIPAFVISLEDLVANKSASRRQRDRDEAATLRKLLSKTK